MAPLRGGLPPYNSKGPPRKNLGGGLGPLASFKGGGGGLFWRWKVTIFKKIGTLTVNLKNNSPAAGYYPITPFSENNIVNTAK